MSKRGRVIVLSGPSGCGKSSVVDELAKDSRFVRSISATTRAPRGSEANGREYHFLGEDEFRAGIASGRFIEWAEVYGRLYGTPRAPLEAALAEGRWVLLNLDPQGARSLRERGEPGLYIFLLPPSLEVLEARLRRRGTDDEATIRRRLAQAAREMEQAPLYDATIVNDDLAHAVEQVKKVALATGHAAEESSEIGAGI
jgi:guanylate kinase